MSAMDDYRYKFASSLYDAVRNTIRWSFTEEFVQNCANLDAAIDDKINQMTPAQMLVAICAELDGKVKFDVRWFVR